MKETQDILLEIHQMLCKISSYIDKIQSPEYIRKSEEKDFAINVAADLYVEQLERLRYGNNNGSPSISG